MKVKMIPIVIKAFGTISKGLLKGLEDLEVGGRVETIWTTALLRTARILRRVQETWGGLLSLKHPLKDYQVTLMGKTLIIIIMIMTILIMRWNMFGRKQKSNITSKTTNTLQGNTSEGTGERRKTENISRQDENLQPNKDIPKRQKHSTGN